MVQSKKNMSITHLNRLCRVCSAIINMKDTILPKMFCSYWAQFKKGKSPPTFSAVPWLQHTNTCSICSEMQKNVKEDAPPLPKRKNVGRPMCTKQSGDIVQALGRGGGGQRYQFW